jgi:hypothetical protein
LLALFHARGLFLQFLDELGVLGFVLDVFHGFSRQVVQTAASFIESRRIIKTRNDTAS